MSKGYKHKSLKNSTDSVCAILQLCRLADDYDYKHCDDDDQNLDVDD